MQARQLLRTGLAQAAAAACSNSTRRGADGPRHSGSLLRMDPQTLQAAERVMAWCRLRDIPTPAEPAQILVTKTMTLTNGSMPGGEQAAQASKALGVDTMGSSDSSDSAIAANDASEQEAEQESA